MFSSTYRVMVEGEGDSVGYLNPLLALAATINVSLPGQQPDMRGAHEDARLLDARLADKTGEDSVPGCGVQVLFMLVSPQAKPCAPILRHCSSSSSNRGCMAHFVGGLPP